MTPLNSNANIAQKAVCLVLNFSALGTTRKVNKTQVLKEDLQTDTDMINTSCLMLDSEELDMLKSKDGELRRWIYNHALPSPFTNGVYLLPNKMITKVEEKLKTFAQEREALAAAFVAAYPRLVQAARSRLGEVFNARNYPGTKAIASYFGFTWDYWTLDTPANLQDISQEFFEQEKQKAQAKWNQAGFEVQMALREAFSQLVNHFTGKLAGLEDGKTKRFHTSSLTNIMEFIDTFADRNIAGDGELAALVAKARKMVTGLDPADLKAQEGLRGPIQAGFEQIKKNLDSLVEEKPVRKITFADEATGTAA